MLVTSQSDSSVLDTENGDVYIWRAARDYLNPPHAWHETHRNSSTIGWDMQWCRYGREKSSFVSTTVHRMPHIVWKQPEGASATWNPSRRNFPQFQVVMQDGVHRFNGYAVICSYLSHSQAAVFHNHLFHSGNHVFRSASAWRRLLRFVFTRRAAFCDLSYPRTHIFYFHNAIIACLPYVFMNCDWFHATQVEKSHNHALLFKCKRRHFQYLKHYCPSTTSQTFNA
jgi:hypothetical protein